MSLLAHRWVFRIVVALVVLGVVQPLAAQSPDESASFEKTVEAGMAAFSRKNYREAHALFTRAHAQRPSARTLRVLGTTEFALDDYSAAREHLSAALADGRQPLEPAQRREVDELLQWMLRNLIALQLDYKPAHANARLDEKAVQPGQLLLAAGEHLLQLSAAGYGSKERQFTLSKGQAPMQLSLSLELLPETPVVAVERSNVWLWVGAGSAVAALGGGVLFGVGRMNVDRAEDPLLQSEASQVAAQRSRGLWFTALGAGLAGVGLAGVALSLVMQLRSGAPDQRAPRSDVAIGPGNVVLTGTF